MVQIAENIFQGNLLTARGTELYLRDVQLQYLPLDNTLMFTLTTSPEGPLQIPEEAILRGI
jgi:hypothetical protein